MDASAGRQNRYSPEGELMVLLQGGVTLFQWGSSPPLRGGWINPWVKGFSKVYKDDAKRLTSVDCTMPVVHHVHQSMRRRPFLQSIEKFRSCPWVETETRPFWSGTTAALSSQARSCLR